MIANMSKGELLMNYDFSNITIADISKVVSVMLHPGSKMDMPNRESEGLIIALSGTLKYFYSGVEYTSDPSHVLLLSKGISYNFISVTDSVSIVINFSTVSPLPFYGVERFEADLRNMANRVENNWAFKKPSYRLKCMEELYSFFIKHNEESAYIPSNVLTQIGPSIRYLEAHYTDSDINNDDLASLSGVSTVYFRKLFTKSYGISPMRYIKIKRIEKAKSILESPYFTSISDVAEACGFNSVYYFSCAFKQETSCSPSEYRMLARNKEHCTF